MMETSSAPASVTAPSAKFSALLRTRLGALTKLSSVRPGKRGREWAVAGRRQNPRCEPPVRPRLGRRSLAGCATAPPNASNKPERATPGPDGRPPCHRHNESPAQVRQDLRSAGGGLRAWRPRTDRDTAVPDPG